MILTQTDSVGSCTSGFLSNRLASVGGSQGSSPVTINLAGDAIDDFVFQCPISDGSTWSAGDWTVRLNVTTANMNFRVTNVYIQRYSSACSSIAILGSVNPVEALSSTGVKTWVISCSGATPNPGDLTIVRLEVSNVSMSAQSFEFTPNQNIDSPFTQVTPSLLWDPQRVMRPHLVRKVREFFLGGLPPKLAKLRMVKHESGLLVPANDPLNKEAA